MTKLRISPSAINLFEDCQLKFKIVYLDNIKIDVNNIYNIFGESIHIIINNFYNSKSFDPEFFKFNWLSIFKNNVDLKLKKVRKDIFNKFLQLGYNILKTFFNHQKEQGLLISPQFSEFKIVKEFDNFIVVGIIDSVFEKDHKIELVDYKTTIKPKTQLGVDQDLQLSFYAWLYYLEFNKIPDILTLHYLRTNQRISTTKSKDEILKFENFLYDFYDKIKNIDNFKPNEDKCILCDYRNYCSFFSRKKIYIM